MKEKKNRGFNPFSIKIYWHLKPTSFKIIVNQPGMLYQPTGTGLCTLTFFYAGICVSVRSSTFKIQRAKGKSFFLLFCFILSPKKELVVRIHTSTISVCSPVFPAKFRIRL